MIRKNVAGQKIGAQMVSASDGSAFTGSVTCSITLDAGTQATGTVGSGACTHEGNGYHTYAPSQAETNGNLAAYTFTGTGAVPVTVQVLTVSFDPHDTVRLALTSLPNAAAEASGGLPTLSAAQASNGTIQSNVHRWLTGTPNALQSGRVDSYLGAVAAGVIAAASFAANALDAAWSAATRVLTAGTNIALAKGTGVTGFNDLSAAQVNAEVDTALADYDAPTKSELDSAVAPLATSAALATVDGIVDDILSRLPSLSITTGAVATNGANSATAFDTNLTETEDDHWKDAFLLLTSGDLVGQVRRITAYDGTTKIVTVLGGFSDIPADAVTFAIINR